MLNLDFTAVTKMAKAGCAARAKLLLIIMNVVFWLSGCGVMAVGIWLKVDRATINLSAALSTTFIANGDAIVEIVAWIFIGTGVFIFVVGVCGLLGALRESKLMLAVYSVCLAFVMIGEFSGAIFTVVKKDEIISSLREHGAEWMRNSYNYSDITSRGFNYVMLKFQCCGVNNYTDFIDSSYVNRTAFLRRHRASITTACCKINPQDLQNTTVDGPEPLNQTACLIEAGEADSGNLTLAAIRSGFSYFNPQGCLTSFVDFIGSNLIVIVAVGFPVAIAEILAFSFAHVLYGHIDEERMYAKT